MAFLFSFSLTGLSLLLPREEQVQRCHHVSYTNKSNAILFIAWRVGKAVYCCAGAVQVVVQVLCMCGGAPYILQAWTCMGLAGALGMCQARPCYWSQTILKYSLFMSCDFECNMTKNKNYHTFPMYYFLFHLFHCCSIHATSLYIILHVILCENKLKNICMPQCFLLLLFIVCTLNVTCQHMAV